jgi:SecD/SecF fusion protein
VTNRRSHLILVGLIVAALAGVAALGVPSSPAHKKLRLGLDLQGGLEVVLKAVPPKGHTLTSSDMDRSVTIMRNRINKLGVSETDARKQGTDQIVIELPGVKDPTQAANIIGTTAQLQMYDLENDVTGPSTDGNGNVLAETNLYHLLQQVQADAKHGAPQGYYLFGADHRLKRGPFSTRQQLLGSAKLGGKVPKGWTVLAVPSNMTVITCPRSSNICPGVQRSQATASKYFYLFKYYPDRKPDQIPEITGNDLKLSAISAQVGTQAGQGNAFVQLGFKGEGNSKFKQITQDEAIRGQQKADAAGQGGSSDQNIVTQFAQHFAIVLDGELKSTPYIDYKQNPNGIDPTGTGAEISNIQSIGEAKNLALVLQTGALPVKFEQIERTDVSATLGKDSLKQAKTAALIGLLIVALFLLVLYRFLGVVAVVGLGIYAAFLYAAILIFGVTLTLPGFAGLILTIGVAADANVVIFERIKEEVRSGKSVRAGIAAGYAKGFRTIIDANVVTVITALVLFAVATAQVKGFALMLMIGTVISLVTAVAATRAMLGLLAGFSWFENPSFMGAHGQQSAKWLQIDFMRRRYLWFAISGVIIAIGLGSLATKGLNLGIDFKGGTQVSFKTPQPVSLSSVRTEAGKFSTQTPEVQGKGTLFGSDGYKSFQLRLRSLNQAKTNQLSDDIKTRFGHGRPISLTIQTVSSSFGRQIARAAITAILFSLFLIVLYIAIRFDFKFAVPVIVALLHDIAITVGVYSLTGREVSNSTVAAVLTVLGYSIYDTIIIFDRIRENVPLMRRAPFATIVGITSGAYSSIFIAAPLLTLWKEREPEFARRREVVPALAGDGKVELEAAEAAAAAEPVPDISPVAAVERTASQAKRERRRQRRRARPHGRAR